MNKLFLAIHGPSGSGKSTLIKKLVELYSSYIYVKPYTTRKLRMEETDKIHISENDFFDKVQKEELILPNHLYGNWYAPSMRNIDEILVSNKMPVIDWPIDGLIDLREKLEGLDILSFYIMPPDLKTHFERLNKDNRDVSGERYIQSKEEINKLEKGIYKGINRIIYNNQNLINLAMILNEEVMILKNDFNRNR